MLDWLTNAIYYEGDMVKTYFSFVCLMLLILLILEGFYIIKSATKF